MLPSVDRQQLKEILFLLGYNFKQGDKELLELPFTYLKEKYDWLIKYKKDKSDQFDKASKSIKSKSPSKIHSK